MQRSPSECGNAMDLWRSFHVAVSVMFSVASIRTHFLVAVETSLLGNVMLVHILMLFQQLMQHHSDCCVLISYPTIMRLCTIIILHIIDCLLHRSACVALLTFHVIPFSTTFQLCVYISWSVVTKDNVLTTCLLAFY